jgi:iron(III) transport system substrate-binding protein
LKPEFKGQMLFPDPRTNPELSAKALAALVQAKGDDFLRRLAAQNLKIVTASTPGMEDLAGGNGMLLAQAYDMNLLAYESKGAPIGVTEAFNPIVGLSFYTQIPKNAPNLEGAKKWVEFAFSPEGQQVANQGIGVSPLGVAAAPGTLSMPSDVTQVDAKKALDQLPHYLDLLNIH